jgi:hypothetical protein
VGAGSDVVSAPVIRSKKSDNDRFVDVLDAIGSCEDGRGGGVVIVVFWNICLLMCLGK